MNSNDSCQGNKANQLRKEENEPEKRNCVCLYESNMSYCLSDAGDKNDTSQ